MELKVKWTNFTLKHVLLNEEKIMTKQFHYFFLSAPSNIISENTNVLNFDAGNIHYEGHWKGLALKIEKLYEDLRSHKKNSNLPPETIGGT
jgi:hypothetical protein